MNRTALRCYFADQSSAQQKLGTVDCVRFVAEALAIGWNRNYLSYLGYNDRRSAVNRLRSTRGLKNAVCDLLGDPVPVTELCVGDIVWFDKPASIGLLMEGYVAVKWGKTIHRFQIEPQMMGWHSGC